MRWCINALGRNWGRSTFSGTKKGPGKIAKALAIIMVSGARFELAAFGSGGQRSIQLSYPPTCDEGLLYSTDAFHSKVFKSEVKGQR